MGFAGIQNFPTVGLIDGTFRDNLEETGMGFAMEVDCIGAARELDLLTTPYAFDAAQAAELASVGADIIVAHMGLTTSGTIGAKTAMDIDAAVGRVPKLQMPHGVFATMCWFFAMEDQSRCQKMLLTFLSVLKQSTVFMGRVQWNGCPLRMRSPSRSSVHPHQPKLSSPHQAIHVTGILLATLWHLIRQPAPASQISDLSHQRRRQAIPRALASVRQ